jgi:hypothetical protein
VAPEPLALQGSFAFELVQAPENALHQQSGLADPLDPNGNHATVAYLNAVARAEGLDLAARLGNPAGLGIHNKLVLVRQGGARYVHVGSLNGSEAAAKIIRVVAPQVQADRAYAHLAAVFAADWAAGR